MAKRVFVVGAGASFDYGLPLGIGLKTKIAQALRVNVDNGRHGMQDHSIRRALELSMSRYGDAPDGFVSLMSHAYEISRGMSFAPSIDNYVHAHSDVALLVRVAKIGIAKAILEAEAASRLNGCHQQEAGQSPGGWLEPFFHRLVEGVRFDDFPNRLKQIGLIVFNYDRCVEYFLMHAVQGFFKVSAFDARQALESLEIVHPYGDVGVLPEYVDGDDLVNAVPFGGGAALPEKVVEAADRLKTFTEGVSESQRSFGRLKEMLADAQTVVFLGFAYASMNLDVIERARKSAGTLSSCKLVLGTAVKVSDADITIIRGRVANLLDAQPGRCHLRNDVQGCAELLGGYSQQLGFGV